MFKTKLIPFILFTILLTNVISLSNVPTYAFSGEYEKSHSFSPYVLQINKNVKTPPSVNDLLSSINDIHLKKETIESLKYKLLAIKNSKDHSKAKNNLDKFIQELNAQVGKPITNTQTNQLVVALQSIIDTIP